jgi:UDP:flavonoid glycosyltransferase YjiC (YdhE family)
LATTEAGEFNCPANVLIRLYAPQVQVLKRASLMVSHGRRYRVERERLHGSADAAHAGIFRRIWNAARVVYHGLGERLRLKELSTLS